MTYAIYAALILGVLAGICVWMDDADSPKPTIWMRVGILTLYSWSAAIGIAIGLFVVELLGL